MRLDEAADEALALLKLYGLNGVVFRWGCTSPTAYGEAMDNGFWQELRLSPVFTPHRKREDVINTIMHEISHLVAGVHHGHNLTWAETAIAMGVRETTDTAAHVVAMAARAC